MVKTNHFPKQFNNKAIKNKLENICIENDIIFMALFGSFITGKQKRKSDIDMLVKFDKKKEKSLLDLIHTENEIKRIFKRKIDLLTIESISPYLKNEILSSMKVIYEK